MGAQDHADKPDTHIISAIINVAQDLEEPWPLEIFGHSGKVVSRFWLACASESTSSSLKLPISNTVRLLSSTTSSAWLASEFSAFHQLDFRPWHCGFSLEDGCGAQLSTSPPSFELLLPQL